MRRPHHAFFMPWARGAAYRKYADYSLIAMIASISRAETLLDRHEWIPGIVDVNSTESRTCFPRRARSMPAISAGLVLSAWRMNDTALTLKSLSRSRSIRRCLVAPMPLRKYWRRRRQRRAHMPVQCRWSNRSPQRSCLSSIHFFIYLPVCRRGFWCPRPLDRSHHVLRPYCGQLHISWAPRQMNVARRRIPVLDHAVHVKNHTSLEDDS